MDGFGLSRKKEHNAISEAKTPVIDELMAKAIETTEILEVRADS